MIEYGSKYYYNLLKIQTEHAEAISNVRWDFIKEHILQKDRIPDLRVLDYGCGIGYMKVFKPDWVETLDTYDLMPVPHTGIKHERYDIITLYDVLEHIPDFQILKPLFNKATYVVTSLPMKPPEVNWNDYKHFKPGEHLHYFDDSLLCHIFSYMGFSCVAKGSPECPPREYIQTYIFQNRSI